jgi:hypothetical protein
MEEVEVMGLHDLLLRVIDFGVPEKKPEEKPETEGVAAD